MNKNKFKNNYMKTFKRYLLISLIFFIFNSCVYDKMRRIDIKNLSSGNYYFELFEKGKNDLVSRRKVLHYIDGLYEFWNSNKVNAYTYLDFKNHYTLNNNSILIPIGVKNFSILYINVDSLYSNYKKQLPIDSFKYYKIIDYNTKELKKNDYKIEFKD